MEYFRIVIYSVVCYLLGLYYANVKFVGANTDFSRRMFFSVALGKKKLWQGQYSLLSSTITPLLPLWKNESLLPSFGCINVS